MYEILWNQGGLVKNIRVDESGDLRCWKCGSKEFALKRTLRSKVVLGVGADRD